MNQKAKGIIGILTGGGDVPGLNPAIRAVTIRALREGYKVIGIRRGWKGLVDVIRDKKVDNSCNYFELTEEIVNKAGRTGGTFLHSSRTRASHVPQSAVPEHLKDKYNAEINDLTPEVLKNLEDEELIVRIPDEEDARFKKIVFTDKAEKIKSILRQEIERTEEVLLRGITPEEKEIFLKITEKMLKNLESEEQ